MHTEKWARACCAIGILVTISIGLTQLTVAQEKGGADVTGPYKYVKKWPQDNFFEKGWTRSEEHTSELQSRVDLVCRLLLEKKKEAAVAGGSRTAAERDGVRRQLQQR